MPSRTKIYILTKDKDSKSYVKLEEMCKNSKNLYNKVNYIIRQAFFGKHDNIPEYKDLIELDKFISEYKLSGRMAKLNQADYRSLRAQCAQHVVKQVYRNWDKYFKTLKAYKKTPSNYGGRPGMPGFKDKKGLNVIVFSNQRTHFDKKTGELQLYKGFIIKSIKFFDGNFQQIRIVPQTGYFKIEVVYDKLETDFITNVKNYNTKENSAAIDIGVDNLATVTSDNPDIRPFIVNGRCVKSINQYYNKYMAKLNGEYISQKVTTGKKWKTLCRKRTMKINDYFHKTSRRLVEWSIENNIGKIFIGKSSGWKNKPRLTKNAKQNFCMIPFNRFIKMISYKMNEVGIEVIVLREDYTSKCSALDNEKICKHKKDEYLGTRTYRGLFKSSTGKRLNADINGSLNILRRGLNHDFNFSNLIFNPIKLKNENEVHDVFKDKSPLLNQWIEGECSAHLVQINKEILEEQKSSEDNLNMTS